MVLYQCVHEPADSEEIAVSTLESILQVGVRVAELARGVETVFHGGYVSIEHPKIMEGNYTKDFGPGFYCTRHREQASRWARRRAPSIVSTYEARITKNLKVLEFEHMTEEWLDFIANCRSGIPHQYDVIMGPMADDQVYNYVNDFLAGFLTREQFWSLARFRYPTHQVVFCTDEALSCLKFISSKEVQK
jgi:hypothetical protein